MLSYCALSLASSPHKNIASSWGGSFASYLGQRFEPYHLPYNLSPEYLNTSVACMVASNQAFSICNAVAFVLAISSDYKLVCWYAGIRHRGWTLADAEGLYLEEVRYPPCDDPNRMLYPTLPHDRFGRVHLEGLPPEEIKAIAISMKKP